MGGSANIAGEDASRAEADEEFPYTGSCEHPLRVGSLCAICGAEVWPAANREDLYAALHSSDQILQTSRAARIQQEIKNRELSDNKKLILILDLDQTVIQTSLDEVRCDHRFEIGGCSFYVKYRPCLRSFLNKVNRLFEIHIYTMGVREYAYKICAAIDPDRFLFGDRIVSRAENFNELTKSIDRISCISDNVVILDDRADVWNYIPNLLLVRPYEYYNTADINDPALIRKKRQQRQQRRAAREGCVVAEGTASQAVLGPTAPDADGSTQRVVAMGSEIVPARCYEGAAVEQPPEHRDGADAMQAAVPDLGADPVSDGLPSRPGRSRRAKRRKRAADGDTELNRLYKLLKCIHREYFSQKKSVQEIIKLDFFSGLSFVCRSEFFPLVEALGGQVNFTSPDYVIECAEKAGYFKLPNISLQWIYECVYARRLIDFSHFILHDFRESVDRIEQELLDEFF